MRKNILRVLNGITLTPALSSKLNKLLPEYTLKEFTETPNYIESITARIESLHQAFFFILEAYPLDAQFTYLTRQTLIDFANNAKAKCNLANTNPEKLHEELVRFVDVLVILIQVAWPWSQEPKVRRKQAIDCLNEAEQYLLMSKGRPNTATLIPMEFDNGLEYLLQIDKALPAYYNEWLEELKFLKSIDFPQTPLWFRNLKPEEQVYLNCLKDNSITTEQLIAGLQNLLEKLPGIQNRVTNWSSDLNTIYQQVPPFPSWFTSLNHAEQEIIKILAKKTTHIEEAVKVFKTLLEKKNTSPSFNAELNTIISSPLWYLLLPGLQQYFLKQVINNAKKIEEVVFFLPSRLRTLPAPANFGAHQLIRINPTGEDHELEGQRYRSSHIVSRDLVKTKLPEVVRHRHNSSNLNQVLRYALKDQKILIQTLISPLGINDELIPAILRPFIPEIPPDQDLYDELQTTIRENPDSSRIHQLNHPINLAKMILYTDPKDPNSIKLIEDTKNKINELENEQPQSRESYTKKEELKKLTLEYEQALNSSPGSATFFDYSGRELFLSSLEQLIILTQKGYSYGSCVSGKDRKAIEIIHTDAMLIYKERYENKWPSFCELDPSKRKNFVNIVVSLYLSRHQQELAGQNAPGSEGIKTPDTYFPKDICDEIQRRLGDKILQYDDRLASDNEVKTILTKHSGILSKENKLKADLISLQLGEEDCTELYSHLFNLIDRIYQESIKSKGSQSNFFKKYVPLIDSQLPTGIKLIKKLMHDNLEAGNNNIQRLAKIIEIVLNRPSNDDSRSPETTFIYEQISGLCKNSSKTNLDTYVKQTKQLLIEHFENAKDKISPFSSVEDISLSI